MFCTKCGKEVDDNAVICVHCGCQLKELPQENKPVQDKNSNSEVGIGVVCGLFLGILGLIIGLCLYPSGTIARKTFMKGWLITFIVTTVLGIVGGIIFGMLSSTLFASLGDMVSM